MAIKGAIVVNGVPEKACFDNFTQLLQALGTYLAVEIPEQFFSNLVVSVAQPAQADRGKPWWRISPSGGFIGIYTYANNVWNQVLPAPNQVFWLYGDSSNPPAGFTYLDSTQTIFSAPDYAQLIAMAIPNGGPEPYVYYPAIYTGF
jgi:hypothetical protein